MNKCRMTRGEWYETQAVEAMAAQHQRQQNPPGDGAAISTLLPKKGRKLCLYFCVPVRPAPTPTEDMDDA